MASVIKCSYNLQIDLRFLKNISENDLKSKLAFKILPKQSKILEALKAC